MKKYILLLLLLINFSLSVSISAQTKKMKLTDLIIAIDPGHGGKDIGTSFKEIKEKDINLSISLLLKKELEKYGATIIMTRTEDYDLSSPNANRRKKSDFDNRIKLLNENKIDLVLSIHQNYYKDPEYNGVQIFYKNNKDLANIIQEKLNKNRKIKKISNTLYMYNKIKSETLLIECGFISNYKDRTNLTSIKYQKYLSKEITNSIIEYFTRK